MDTVAPNKNKIITTNDEMSEVWGNPEEMTELQTRLLAKKKVLLSWYRQIYEFVISNLYDNGKIIEMGSGSSFIHEHIPGLIRSNILFVKENDIVFSAFALPFKDSSVSDIILINVLHHLQNPLNFFKEAERVLKPGGRVLISDPYISLLSYPVWHYFHPENCERKNIGFNNKGEINPMIDANSATATNMFYKKNTSLADHCHFLRTVKVELHSKFLYWIAGGYNFPQFIPTNLTLLVKIAEKMLSPLDKWLASFMYVVLEKTEAGHV
jgi:SAM-dependent methyltransferase